ELREDEDAVAVGELLLDQLEEHLELRGAFELTRGGDADEARIAADLAELHQRVEHADDTRGEALLADEAPDAGVGGDADALVELALLVAEIDGADDLRLRGQITRHVALEAPQDEGSHPALELGEARVVALFDGEFVALAELIGLAEHARHQEVEEAEE